MPSSPADIGPANVLVIPPDQTVAYESPDLLVAIESSSDTGLNYIGSALGNDGSAFGWSFTGYDVVTPVSGDITQVSAGPDATFLVPSGGMATFELSNPFFTDVMPIEVIIDSALNGPPVALQQLIGEVTPDGPSAAGISLSFIDPMIASGIVTWPV